MKFTGKHVGNSLVTDDLPRQPGSGLDAWESDPRWSLVNRIAASPRFARAAQLRSFLLYASRRFLIDKAGEISEQEVGVKVFRRRASFDPGQDTIVRVQARQLRRKLEEYFAEEGKEEELVVTIPKGSYLPEFGPRAQLAPALPNHTESVRMRLVALVLTLLVVLLAILSTLLWKRNAELSSPPRTAGEPAYRTDPLWARMFAQQQKTNVVVGDANLVLLEDILESDITLQQYLSREYPNNLLSAVSSDQVRRILEMMSTWRNGWYGDFGVAKLIFDQNRGYAGRAQVRFPRGLNIGELKTDNFVMLGSRRSIPWVQLFENRLLFAVEYEPKSGLWIRDKSTPEQTAYRFLSHRNGVHETYSRVALVPNLGGTGSVLLLTGLTTEATEGAVTLLTGPNFAAKLNSTQGCTAVDARTDSFELLLRTRTVVGAPMSSEVVACHPVAGAIDAR